jgi:hypothetical protein
MDLIGCFVRTSLHFTNVRIVAMDGNELTVSILSPNTKILLKIQGNIYLEGNVTCGKAGSK